jgi:putative ABC transport system substrate-binding protein
MRRAHRRKFLLASSAFLAAPLASFAQAVQKVRKIGFLSADVATSGIGQGIQRLFPESLRRFGYEERKNIVIEWRWGEAKSENLPALAEALVRLNVELIVARTNDPIEAAKRVTRTIPIVMFNGNYPVEVGFIESLARPGGNITGTSYQSPELTEKQLQLLKEVAPHAVRIAAMWDSNVQPDTGLGKVLRNSLERAAARLKMTIQYFEVSRPDGVSAALNRIATSRVDALWFSGFPIFRQQVQDIPAFALKQGLVMISAIPTIVELGGLLDYSPDYLSSVDRTASYVDRILKGAKPADLPVDEPTKFTLAINLKTAKALGLKIPQSLLIRADRVIE